MTQQDFFKKLIIPSIMISVVLGAAGGGGAGYLGGLYAVRIEALPGEQQVGGTPPAPPTEEQLRADYEQQVIRVVEQASPAVVSIIATKDLPIIEREFVNPFSPDDPFNQFFGPFDFRVPQYREKGTEKREVSGGTGFIISSDGLIITNRHVVDVDGAEYTVLTNAGERIPAEVLARDPVQDIAIVKVARDGLPTIPLGDSDSVKIGQTAIAIGNALGEFQNTVSAGVVAGLKRNVVAGGGMATDTVIDDAIQTDAAINRGNSGGPLLNLRGEVIGINSVIVVGSQNIGFAIPINHAKKAADDVKRLGKIIYPYLGVRYILVNEELVKEYDLSVDYGALVLRGEERTDLAVIPGSPADKAGIVENDIILEVNGVHVDEENSLASLIQRREVGETVTLKVLSKGQEKTVPVVLEERK